MSNAWYKEGLSFSCTGCGKCCTGSPGYVWVTIDEMEAISNFLKITLKEFTRKYVRKVGNRFSLIESKKNFDCTFLKEGKCTVYEARPTQCRTFPFWPQNLSSEEAWENVAKECEGIHEKAEKVAVEDIEKQQLIQIKRNRPPQLDD